MESSVRRRLEPGLSGKLFRAPPKLVTYGEGTTDEMCLAYIGVLLPAASSGAALRRF